MTRTTWKETAELIGITAIVVSLVFVGLQLKQSQDIVLSELDAALNAIDVEITGNIGDHADVWVRGNNGAQLSDSELAIYGRLVSDINTRHQTSYRRNIRFGRVDVARINVAILAVFLHTNPGAKIMWESGLNTLDYQKLGIDRTAGPFNQAVKIELDKLAQAPE